MHKFKSGPKILDEFIQVMEMDSLDEIAMAKAIQEYIEETHTDAEDVFPATFFGFDLRSIKMSHDDYIPAMFVEFAQSDYLDIKWHGVLHELKNPHKDVGIFHPMYIYFVWEV